MRAWGGRMLNLGLGLKTLSCFDERHTKNRRCNQNHLRKKCFRENVVDDNAVVLLHLAQQMSLSEGKKSVTKLVATFNVSWLWRSHLLHTNLSLFCNYQNFSCFRQLACSALWRFFALHNPDLRILFWRGVQSQMIVPPQLSLSSSKDNCQSWAFLTSSLLLIRDVHTLSIMMPTLFLHNASWQMGC